MKNQDWKLKYADLKLKFHDAVDTAFRLGFEQGANNAQLQQLQQDQAAAQAGQMGGMGEDPNAQMESGMGQNDGSELDQHIGTLEGMLNQSKPGSPEQAGIKKSLDFLFGLKQKYELKKSEQAIKAIGRTMKAPFTLGKAATKNLSESGKKALNMQEQIVADLMKSMDEEETKAKEAITKTLNLEQLLKG